MLLTKANKTVKKINKQETPNEVLLPETMLSRVFRVGKCLETFLLEESVIGMETYRVDILIILKFYM